MFISFTYCIPLSPIFSRQSRSLMRSNFISFHAERVVVYTSYQLQSSRWRDKSFPMSWSWAVEGSSRSYQFKLSCRRDKSPLETSRP